MAKKKLIEVALPLEKINAESAREKSIRHGHPSTLHLWWARRPLAAARAIIWSSLVDDPSSHPELFPTEEDQIKERQRLFKILEKLIVWDNSNDEHILAKAKEEIIKSTDGEQLAFLDPFSGGGAIPFEAQRLGLEVHAHDLNPIAVMINNAMVMIPARFANSPPVNPETNRLAVSSGSWTRAAGLAEDINYYGECLKNCAFKIIGKNYPKVKIPASLGGGESTAAAWIWARTVTCSNPACGRKSPLVKSFTLSGKQHIKVDLHIRQDGNINYEVTHNSTFAKSKGTVDRSGARCVHCGSPISFAHIKEEGKKHNLGADLMAVVFEGKGGKSYLSPDTEQMLAADVERISAIDGDLAFYPGYVNPVAYGLTSIEDLFSNRQLVAIDTFTELVSVIQKEAEADAVSIGMPNDHIALIDGGKGAQAYGEAIAIYLAFVVDKLADRCSTICGWDSSRDGMRNTFGLTGMPMSWDYAEVNPFSNSSGCFDNMLNWVVKCVQNSPKADVEGIVKQHDAQTDSGLRNVVVSTDPPYYSNVPYADFADFFYVLMRKGIRHVFPELFSTMLTPKVEELVADPYRMGGKQEAADYFEKGMLEACKNIYLCSREDVPVTIYYAFKQSDGEQYSETSTGWETMLTAIIKAGFSINGTWPVRTELANRSRSIGSNALASSIVLVCRKRSIGAPAITRRNFINALKRELRPALQKLQSSNIAPVDLAQSAIGPGMGVYSKYSQVLEADGTPMSVRSALKIINQELDLYFNEQDGELDSESRFCVDLYSQVAFNDMKFGDANTLATAKNTSVAIMAGHGTLYAQKGVVHLIERSELPDNIREHEECIWMLCQQLTYRMEKEGVEGCAKAIFNMFGTNAERAKDLAYRLYTIAERKKWAQEAYAYNALVVAWPEIQSRAAELKAIQPKQLTIFDVFPN